MTDGAATTELNSDTKPITTSTSPKDADAGKAAARVPPRHPMPAHFPELRHRDPAPAQQPVQQAVPPPDPHSVHDGSGYQPERSVCVRCGSTNLARGYVVDLAKSFNQTHFAPRKVTTRRLNSALRPFRMLAKLEALACRDCGAVLLIVEPSELRRAEHRRE
jgi:hypothetical protein